MRIPITIALVLLFVSGDLSSDYFRDGGFLANKGVLESIRIEPRLPAFGESFSVNLSGSWSGMNADGLCFAALEVDQVVVHAGNGVQAISNLQHDPAYCDQPPAHWNLDVPIPASAWDAVDEEGFLLIEHLLFSGINMLTGIDQNFDMRLGTHEVPAFLGAGFWVSAAKPFEGIMIEQQGGRVLFYGLGYDRDASQGDDGEPVWIMLSGKMSGDSTLGRAYRYDWPMDAGGFPEESPTHDELLTVNDSGAIIVNDYNNVRAFTETTGNVGRYQDYQRLTFGVDTSRLPVYVPPLGGRWTLQGFDDQNAVFTASLELLEGDSPAPNQYRFASVSGDWTVLCSIEPPGIGDCSFEHVVDEARFDFPLSAFQGNLARGILDPGNGNTLDGVLVRYPWRLPVSVR